MANQPAEKDIIEIPSERIIGRIFLLRGVKVMVDRDLAELYGVKVKALNQAVKRNIDRFPSDFMFQLDKQEMDFWKSQIVTSNADKKGLRKPPFVFTEQGVAMLSSVLHSRRAIQVNIQIIRTFIKLRGLIATNRELWEKIEAMEKKYDEELRDVFEVLRSLLIQQENPKEPIGFK